MEHDWRTNDSFQRVGEAVASAKHPRTDISWKPGIALGDFIICIFANPHSRVPRSFSIFLFTCMDLGVYVCNMLAQGLRAAWHSFYDIWRPPMERHTLRGIYSEPLDTHSALTSMTDLTNIIHKVA